MGKHPLIKQLVQGAFNRNPPKPRYSDTWDVESVLAYIKRLGSNAQLVRKELTHKLAMLIRPRARYDPRAPPPPPPHLSEPIFLNPYDFLNTKLDCSIENAIAVLAIFV